MIQDPLHLPAQLPLPVDARNGTTHYLLDDTVRQALRFAWARQRPLLIEGETGIGKSQLAVALAQQWRVPLWTKVVQSTTQADDLLWQFDAVQRLAEAQWLGALGKGAGDLEELEQRLAPLRFVRPGPLWWAWDWAGLVQRQKNEVMKAGTPSVPEGWQPEHGSVVLIDEIDKAPSDLPNNLLDMLDAGGFTLPWTGERVQAGADTSSGTQTAPPFLVITSNGDRDLPLPFLRRCIVLKLRFGDGMEDVAWLRRRAQVHFGVDAIDPEVLTEAAQQILEDRRRAGDAVGHRPGVSEFLDLLHVAQQLGATPEDQLALLRQMRPFVQKSVSLGDTSA